MLGLILTAAAAPARASQIHVEHNISAKNLLARCDQAARNGLPARTAELLTELVDQYSEQLVMIEPDLFLPVHGAALRMVSKWPADLLAHVSRAWHQKAAQDWRHLAATPDIAEAVRFARGNFLTRPGTEAAERGNAETSSPI